METPLPTKRITRSQTKAAAAAAALNSVPISISGKNEQVPESKQRNGKSDRSALIDITNDSPIVGLAMGGSLKTPSSFSKKKDLPKMRMMTTPGSGEALLRREVKTLLQKVEEEADGSKFSFEHHRLFLHLDGVVDSSSYGVRPPIMINNTSHVFNLPSKSNASGDDIKDISLKPTSQVEAEFRIPKVEERIDGLKKQQESLESEKSLITRSLLFDFSEKSSSVETSSESSSICSSVGSVSDQVESDEDDDGVWSIRVNNKSISIQTKEEEEYYDDDEEEEEEESEGRGGGGGWIDELCEGVMKISVHEKRIIVNPGFEGKHTRFVYNSEDEIDGEEEDVVVRIRKSPLHLKGLPTPLGKHLRFSNEDQEEDI